MKNVMASQRICSRQVGAWWCILLVCFLLHNLPVRAGLGPENCVLVVNGSSPESQRIGYQYAEWRKIHSRNVIVLSDVPAGEKCSVADFKEKILLPIFQAISERKLDGQIHCVIYSSGFPTQIDFQAWAKDLQPPLEKHQTPIGSLTSMTYLYRWVLAEQPAIVGFDTNHYARRGPSTVLDFPLSSTDGMDRFTEARRLYDAGQYLEADAIFATLLKEHPFQCGLAYWQCRCQAKLGDETAAAQALVDAARRGWRFRNFTESDPELGDMAKAASFQATLKALNESYWEFAVPLSFSAQVNWSPSGFPENLDQSPHRYLLAVSLGVVGTNTKTNTPEELLAYLQRSAAVDYTQPKGKFFFANTKDVRSTTRMPNFTSAVKALTAMGYTAEIVTDSLPRNAKAVLGATLGTPNFDWLGSGSKFQPGAIGDNLTSWGARFDDGNSQTTVGEFLRAGAGGAAGTVVEPYAIQNKFPYPLIHAYYARGFSLAEAFYLSVNGPYQLLVVGDAICQPFSRPPLIEVKLTAEQGKVKGNVPITLGMRDNSPTVQRIDLYMDGLRVGAVGEAGLIQIDTTQHADGYHELRFVPVGADSTQASSRVVVPLQFNNQGHETKLAAKVEGDVVRVRVQATGAQAIKVFAFQELLEQRDEASFELTVPRAKLGSGPVVLQAVANFGEQAVASAPQTVTLP